MPQIREDIHGVISLRYVAVTCSLQSMQITQQMSKWLIRLCTVKEKVTDSGTFFNRKIKVISHLLLSLLYASTVFFFKSVQYKEPVNIKIKAEFIFCKM